MSASTWYVAKGKTKLGPFSREQLQQMARTGQLAPGDMVLQEGSGKWIAAHSIDGVFVRAQPLPVAQPKRRAPVQVPLAVPTKPVARRSYGKAALYLGAGLAVCACLAAIPVSLVGYYLVVGSRAPNADAQAAAANRPPEEFKERRRRLLPCRRPTYRRPRIQRPRCRRPRKRKPTRQKRTHRKLTRPSRTHRRPTRRRRRCRMASHRKRTCRRRPATSCLPTSSKCSSKRRCTCVSPCPMAASRRAAASSRVRPTWS